MNIRIPTFKIGVLASAIALLSACGSAEPEKVGTPISPNGKGHVALVLTDAPSTEFSEINVTIEQVVLIGDDDTQSYVLFSGEKTIDLLTLKNYSELFGLAENVPAGSYEKIRLILKQPNGIQLVRKDAEGNIIETAYPHQPGNGKLDLNPRGTIVVTADSTTYVQLDFDAAKSIHIVQTGNGKYQFRPVIFVDVLNRENPGKLVRHVGVVQTIDQDARTLRLCASAYVPLNEKGRDGRGVNEAGETHVDDHDDENENHQFDSCMRVDTTNAVIFDNEGKPTTTLAENDSVMVVGYLTRSEKSDDEEHYHHYRVALAAEVIEKGPIGTYTVINGTVKEDASDINTPVTLITDNNVEVSAEMQAETKVFSRRGERLDISGIDKDVGASVDGVWTDEATHKLRATLVILDIVASASETHLTGTIKQLDLANGQIQVTTAMGDMTVLVSLETDVFAINNNAATSVSQRINLDQLVVDARIDVYAHTAINGNLHADTIVSVSE